MRRITPTELAARLAAGETPMLLDVREPWEFEHCRIEGAQLMPMASVPARLAELDPARETVVICHHGGRSMQVCMFLERQGFDLIVNLDGGVAAWAEHVDPMMPRY